MRDARPVIALVLALVIAGCGGDGSTTGSAGPAPGADEAVLLIETATGRVEVRVEVADTPEKRQQGLMGRPELAPDAGMVFLHDEPTSSGFWMKDTLIPLSVAFWDDQGRIIGFADMEPCPAEPCPTYPAPAPWIGAVEVNQGFFEEHGVQVGNVVHLVSEMAPLPG